MFLGGVFVGKSKLRVRDDDKGRNNQLGVLGAMYGIMDRNQKICRKTFNSVDHNFNCKLLVVLLTETVLKSLGMLGKVLTNYRMSNRDSTQDK